MKFRKIKLIIFLIFILGCTNKVQEMQKQNAESPISVELPILAESPISAEFEINVFTEINKVPKIQKIKWAKDFYFVSVDENKREIILIERPENIDFVNDCSCGEQIFLCPEKTLANKDNLLHWNEFCQCVKACSEGNKDAIKKGDMNQEELELNCSDYCASYADEVSSYADEKNWK